MAEAIAVLSLISSVLTTFEAIQELYEAVNDTKGLPRKFRAAADRIPLVHHVLGLAEQSIKSRSVSKGALDDAKPVLERCKENATALHEMFSKSLPAKDLPRTEQMSRAMTLKTKNGEVKRRMEDIIKDMEVLAQYQIFTDAQVLKDIEEAIDHLNRVSNEEDQPQFQHSGTGPMNVNTGQGVLHANTLSGSGTQYNATNQYFGPQQDHGGSMSSIAFFKTSEYELRIAAHPHRTQGTCMWFLRHRRYIEWCSSREQDALWLAAAPGLGKSVLVKTLVEEVLPREFPSSLVLYYFFERTRDEAQLATALCAILHQLFCSQQGESLFASEALPLIKQYGESLKTNVDKLWYLFALCIDKSAVTQTFCVLDAIDECRSQVCDKLGELLGTALVVEKATPTPWKFFITGRDNPQIERSFRRLTRLERPFKLSVDHEGDAISLDIKLMREERIRQLSEDRQLTSNEVAVIRRKITVGRDPTYLYVSLMMDYISRIPAVGPKQFITAVEKVSVPPNVEAAYQMMLRESTNCELAREILSYIVASVPAISVDALDILLAVRKSTLSLEDIHLRGFKRLALDARTVCGPIVKVSNGRIGLVHSTAYQFLGSGSRLDTASRRHPPQKDEWKGAFDVEESLEEISKRRTWLLLLLQNPRPPSSIGDLSTPIAPQDREIILQKRQRLENQFPGIFEIIDEWDRTPSGISLTPLLWLRRSLVSFGILPSNESEKQMVRLCSATQTWTPVWFGLSAVLPERVTVIYRQELGRLQKTCPHFFEEDNPIIRDGFSLLVAASSDRYLNAFVIAYNYSCRNALFSGPFGQSALRIAIRLGHADAIESLLWAGVSARSVAFDGQTAVHLAASLVTQDMFRHWYSLLAIVLCGEPDYEKKNANNQRPLDLVRPIDLLPSLQYELKSYRQRLRHGFYIVSLWIFRLVSLMLTVYLGKRCLLPATESPALPLYMCGLYMTSFNFLFYRAWAIVHKMPLLSAGELAAFSQAQARLTATRKQPTIAEPEEVPTASNVQEGPSARRRAPKIRCKEF